MLSYLSQTKETNKIIIMVIFSANEYTYRLLSKFLEIKFLTNVTEQLGSVSDQNYLLPSQSSISN